MRQPYLLTALLVLPACGFLLLGEADRLSFRHVIIDADPPSGAGGYLDVCAVGDVDGDGKADIMCGSEHSVGVVWYHHPSWNRYPIGAGDFTTDGEIADLDEDGDGDVVISCISRDVIEWWENAGDPFRQNGWTRHEIGPRFAHDLAVGDINGDGRLDVVMFRKNGPRQVTWFAAPDDPRAAWVRHEIAAPPGEGLDVGDVDGDGDLDIAAGRHWYGNTKGDGLTWSPHEITSRWGDDCRDIIADINADGQADIVLTQSEGEGRFSWFEGPNWTEHRIESATLVGAHSLEVGDLDADGDLDVMTGEMHTSPAKRVLVYENLGAGLTWQRIFVATSGTHNARLGDVGGDADLDIIGKNYDGPKAVEMWENLTR